MATNNFVKKWIKLTIDKKWWVLAGTTIFTMLFALGGVMELNTDYHYFFGKNNQQVIAYDKFQQTFSEDDIVMLLIAPKNEKIFTRENLSAIEYFLL